MNNQIHFIDWNYLRPLTEIELQIRNCLEKIRSEQPLWSEPFVNSLKNFPTLFFAHDFNVDSDEKQSCQVLKILIKLINLCLGMHG